VMSAMRGADFGIVHLGEQAWLTNHGLTRVVAKLGCVSETCVVYVTHKNSTARVMRM